MDRYVKEPRATLIKEVRRLGNLKEVSETVRLEEIKSAIKEYIVDFEVFCFDEAWE